MYMKKRMHANNKEPYIKHVLLVMHSEGIPFMHTIQIHLLISIHTISIYLLMTRKIMNEPSELQLLHRK